MEWSGQLQLEEAGISNLVQMGPVVCYMFSQSVYQDVNQFVFERLLVIYILQVELNFDPLPIKPPVAQWLAPPDKTSEGRLREVENAPPLHP